MSLTHKTGPYESWTPMDWYWSASRHELLRDKYLAMGPEYLAMAKHENSLMEYDANEGMRLEDAIAKAKDM